MILGTNDPMILGTNVPMILGAVTCDQRFVPAVRRLYILETFGIAIFIMTFIFGSQYFENGSQIAICDPLIHSLNSVLVIYSSCPIISSAFPDS